MTQREKQLAAVRRALATERTMVLSAATASRARVRSPTPPRSVTPSQEDARPDKERLARVVAGDLLDLAAEREAFPHDVFSPARAPSPVRRSPVFGGVA